MPIQPVTALTDVHAHFLTDEYVAHARVAGVEEPDGMPSWPSWSVDDHLEVMADNGIGHAVLSISSPGVYFGDTAAATDLARRVNDAAAAAVTDRPDRFSFFASLPLPDVDAAITEAERALTSLGAAGIVVMSNTAGRYLGDPALNPLWHRLNKRRAIVFIHPTSPPNADTVALGRPRPMVEFMFETTRTVTDLIFAGVTARYPDIRFLLPHCGATVPLLAARIELIRSLWPGPDGAPPGSMTTAQQLQRFWYDIAGQPLPVHAGVLRDTVGDDHILYGSDYCWTPAFLVGQYTAALDSDRDTDWRAMTSVNAQRFLLRGAG
jgi:6-methylsalicylate decarboxylase